MLFKKEDLQDMAGNGAPEGFKIISNDITGNGRWSIYSRLVFEHDGKFYESSYGTGATENQDESPYEYDPAEIECAEVFPKEKTITVYEKEGSND